MMVNLGERHILLVSRGIWIQTERLFRPYSQKNMRIIQLKTLLVLPFWLDPSSSNSPKWITKGRGKRVSSTTRSLDLLENVELFLWPHTWESTRRKPKRRVLGLNWSASPLHPETPTVGEPVEGSLSAGAHCLLNHGLISVTKSKTPWVFGKKSRTWGVGTQQRLTLVMISSFWKRSHRGCLPWLPWWTLLRVPPLLLSLFGGLWMW